MKLRKKPKKNKKYIEEQLVDQLVSLSKAVKKSDKMAEANVTLNESAVSADSAVDNDHCGHCKMLVENGIQCRECWKWYHYDKTCSQLDDAERMPKYIKSKYISYTCAQCYNPSKCPNEDWMDKSWNKMVELDTKLRDMQNHIKSQLEVFQAFLCDEFSSMYGQLRDMKVKIDQEKHENNAKATYANTLKKNTLVVKSTVSTSKASDSKKDIMMNITSNVEQVKTSDDGHLLIRFADENKMEAAKSDLNRMKNNINVTVDKKDMLRPKIQICDVDEDEVEEEIIETIKNKNQWLNPLISEDDDFKIIKKKKSRQEHKKHVIIKCSPSIRQAIHQREDKLYTTYGRCKVYDSYVAYQCYKCQGFAHSANRCSKAQVCAKCGQGHKTKDCNESTIRCHNCSSKGYNNVDHGTYDSNCPVYMEEIARIKNKTDHGF